MTKLNILLADFIVANQVAYNLHWNVRGKHFLSIHKLTEKLYEDLTELIDEIAEKISMMGQLPLSTLKEALEASTIEESKTKYYSDQEVIEIVVKNLDKLEKTALQVEGVHNVQPLLDEVFMFIDKTRWLFRSFNK